MERRESGDDLKKRKKEHNHSLVESSLHLLFSNQENVAFESRMNNFDRKFSRDYYVSLNLPESDIEVQTSVSKYNRWKIFSRLFKPKQTTVEPCDNKKKCDTPFIVGPVRSGRMESLEKKTELVTETRSVSAVRKAESVVRNKSLRKVESLSIKERSGKKRDSGEIPSYENQPSTSAGPLASEVCTIPEVVPPKVSNSLSSVDYLYSKRIGSTNMNTHDLIFLNKEDRQIKFNETKKKIEQLYQVDHPFCLRENVSSSDQLFMRNRCHSNIDLTDESNIKKESENISLPAIESVHISEDETQDEYLPNLEAERIQRGNQEAERIQRKM